MSALVKTDISSHWYLRDGTPFHEVPNKSKPGEMRPTTIRDAQPVRAVPSVTNILGMIDKPAIANYRVEQGILASLTLPRLPGESDEDFAHRVVEDSEAHMKSSQKAGTGIDEACKRWIVDRSIDDEFAPYVRAFAEWFKRFDGLRSIVDVRIVDLADGYAGTADGIVFENDRQFWVYDIKSQDVKIDKRTGKPAPGFYPEWPEQLAAYCAGFEEMNPMLECLGAFSAVVDRKLIDGESRVFPKQYLPINLGLSLSTFQAAATIWRNRKGYDPRETAH